MAIISDAASHLNEWVSLTAKAYSARTMGEMTLVNLGAAYPDQLLTLVLREGAKDKFKDLEGKIVTVSGKVIDYKGKPEIVVTDEQQLKINE